MSADLPANNGHSLYASIEALYKDFRQEFVKWMRKTYSCSDEDAIEIFQISAVIVYENIVSGKLKQLNSSIKTYLFAVGRNKFMEHTRHRSKFVYSLDFNMEDESAARVEQSEEKEAAIDQVINAMDQLGEKCKEILHLFYYKNYSMEQIAESLQYNNADTVKNLKYKCLNRLKLLVKPS